MNPLTARAHLERFGRDEVSHRDVFCSVHSDEACLAYSESLHGGADRVVREIARTVLSERKRIVGIVVVSLDSAVCGVSAGTCE
jgi:hypothetical protein